MQVDLDALSTGVLFDQADAPASGKPEPVRVRGTIVGRYVLLRLLGSGGMGEVWAAWDPQLDREIAIKFLRRVRSARDRQRLLREAQAMARVAHPNIVVVHDAGEDAGEDAGGLFVAMELVHGQTLRAWRAEHERSWQQLVAVYVEAARGLMAAHEVGLVHRDFKPDNAMIETNGQRVLVMDFGLAAIIDDPARPTRDDGRSLVSSSAAFLDKLTQASALVGTPAYMSPEQFAGRSGGPATDQFSLCLSLWEALFGERPYPGATMDEVERAMHEGRLRAPTDPRVPERVVHALARGLKAAPDQRWPSMRELIAELEAPERKSNRVRLGALAFALGALVAVAGWFGSRSVQACADQRPRLAGIWDQTQRSAIEHELDSVGPHGAETGQRVLIELDAWTQRWMLVAAGACQGNDGVPEALEVAQALCLEHDRQALALTVELLSAPLPDNGPDDPPDDPPDNELVNHAVELVLELPAPERCADVEQLLALDDDRRVAGDPEVGDALAHELLEAEVLARAGRWNMAVDLLRPLAEAPALTDHAALEAQVLGALGWAYYQQRESTLAIETLERGYELSLSTGADALAAELAIDLVFANTRGRPKLDAARTWDLHARALLERSAAGSLVRADRLAAIGFVDETAGELEPALAHYREAEQLLASIGADLRRARLLDDIGALEAQLGHIDVGRSLQLESLAALSELLGPQHPDVASVHYKLGSTAFAAGEVDEATEHFTLAIEIGEASLGRDAALVSAARTGLGALRLIGGDHQGARAVFLQVIDSSERRFGPTDLELVPPLVNTCVAEIALAELVAAERRCLRALEILEAAHGPEHPALLAALDNLGDIRAQRDDPSGAQSFYRRSLTIGELAYGPDNIELDYALVGLGEASLALAQHDDARAWFERVLMTRALEGKHLGLLARAEFGLAQLDALAGRTAVARERAQRALADMRRAPSIEQSMLSEIEAFLSAP